MNAEEKFLIDVGLIALIIIIWVRGDETGQGTTVRRADQSGNGGPNLGGLGLGVRSGPLTHYYVSTLLLT